MVHQPQAPSSSTPALSSSSSSQPALAYHAYPTPQHPPQVPEPPTAPPPASPPQPVERTETVTKSYVVHELDQEDETSKPLWKDTMAAMFGDHVQWEELRVYTGKSRPMSTSISLVRLSPHSTAFLLHRSPRSKLSDHRSTCPLPRPTDRCPLCQRPCLQNPHPDPRS